MHGTLLLYVVTLCIEWRRGCFRSPIWPNCPFDVRLLPPPLSAGTWPPDMRPSSAASARPSATPPSGASKCTYAVWGSRSLLSKGQQWQQLLKVPITTLKKHRGDRVRSSHPRADQSVPCSLNSCDRPIETGFHCLLYLYVVISQERRAPRT